MLPGYAGRVSHEAQVVVAVAQWAPGPDKEVNRRTLRRLAGEAASEGARVVVFPEYSSYFESPLGPGLAEASEVVDGPFTMFLAELARELGVFLVAGMVERSASEGKVHNTLVAVDDSGAVVSVYRKAHLYDAFGARESDWMARADLADPAVFDCDGIRFGLQTCYDIRFPEVSRRLVDAGADVLVVPAEWVRGEVKELHWRTLLAARAIENTCYVVAADHMPPSGIGCSVILDPLGRPLAELSDELGLAVAPVRESLVTSVREVNPALRLRRFTVQPSDL